jgi:P-type Cu+ transporter
MATDPICGMFVDDRTAQLRLVRDNRTYFFCSAACREEFAAPREARQRLRRRLAVAWPLAAVVVAITYGFPSTDAFVLAAVLAGVVQLYAGAPFYRGTWDAIRSRTGNMDVLIAVGTTTAYLYSLLALGLPSRFPAALYFDASSLILAMILTGNYLESLVRDRAGSALERLAELVPASVEVVAGATPGVVPLEEVRPGWVVRVLPGARFPVDGTVRSGRTSVEESLLTGEPLPVPRAPGDRVLAGSLNGNGAVEVTVGAIHGDTFVAQVGRLLSEAEESRVPLRRTADRIASLFVPAVLGLAAAAAVAWLLVGGASATVALLVFVTVAITACPCAFGLATPAAIVVGVGTAAEEGVLFRGEDALERASRADLVMTDKTGTLTEPDPVVSRVVAAPGYSPEEVLRLAAGLEAGSEHVLARAVRESARSLSTSSAPPVTGVVADPGRGVRGTRAGRPVALLNGTSAADERVDLTPLREAVAAVEQEGDGWSVAVEDGRAIGLLAFRSAVVPGVAEAIASLRRMGVEVVMVTGDRSAAALRVAREVGITEVASGVSPPEKVALVHRYTDAGRHVAFVGDGINDAPALAAAEVGIAIGAGSDVAREAGQVLLVGRSFTKVPVALATARSVVARVRGNLTWAIGYNSVLLPIAAGALVPLLGFGVYRSLPFLGALAMSLSSTAVLLNSLLLRRALRARPGSIPSATPTHVAAPGSETV